MHSKALALQDARAFVLSGFAGNPDQRLELVQLAVKEVTGALPARAGAAGRGCAAAQASTASGGTTSSASPWASIQSQSGCATLPSSKRATGGATATSFAGASWLRPRNATNAPKENPPNHNAAPGKRRRPSATTAARSSVSPRPLSNAAGAGPYSTKIEAQRRRTAFDHGARKHVRHLVVHGAAVERMRMTDHTEDRGRWSAASGNSSSRFERAGRPRRR